MLTYRNLAQADYTSLVSRFIKLTESLHQTAVNIGDSKATIGYGYTFNRNNNVAIWTTSGIQLTAAQWQVLRNIDAASNGQKTTVALTFNRTLTAAEGDLLLAAALPIFEAPADALGMPMSYEKAAFVSVMYNRGQNRAMPDFASAITAANRAEAWFQLRYNALGATAATFRNGVAKRRFVEAEVFGLSDAGAGAPSTAEAQQIYSMLTKHRAAIVAYEALYGAPADGTRAARNMIAEAGTDGTLTAIATPRTLVDSLSPAYSAFMGWADGLRGSVAPGIDRGIISNAAAIFFQGSDTEGKTLDARVDDARSGQSLNNNLLVGGAGADNLFGGKGKDYLIGGAGTNQLDGGDDNDTLVGGADTDNMQGGKGEDKLYGGDGADEMHGGAEKDTLYGGLKKDMLYGDAGEDELHGDQEGDELFGGKEKDKLYGDDGEDTLHGDEGNDELYGGKDKDTLHGDAGDDSLFGEAGDDEIHGGKDKDKLTGDIGNDTLFGDDGVDTLFGGNDKDELRGGKDKDELYGEQGNDTLYGDEGNDTLDGGAGMDTLEGGADDDELKGGLERDILKGDKGADTLYGGDGRDALEGGENDDKLYGEVGNDWLEGGAGKDRMEGGAGNDVYVADKDDTISDEDGSGSVRLDQSVLTGGSRKKSDPENIYKSSDGRFTYTLAGSTLKVNGLTIENFANGRLGINLRTEEDKPPKPPKPDIRPPEKITSPIVLDLDGDGVETTALGGAYFDFDGDGFSEKTSWASPDDGLLVNDINGDGLISTGRELFGNNTLLKNGQLAANGFQALAEQDDNGDGVIDATDAAYGTLRVWQDLNGNGLSEADELKTLAEAGVKSISTAYANSDKIDANGNAHKQTAGIELSNGQASTAADVWFQVDGSERIDNGLVELSDEVLEMANARGFGDVHDLRQAMVLDSGLKGLLEQYLAESDSTKRSGLLDLLIYRWTGSANVDPRSRDPRAYYGHVMDARQLVALEHLTASSYLGTWCWGERDPNPHGAAAPLLIAEYLKFKRYTNAQLLVQTEFAPEFKELLPYFGSYSDGIICNWDKLEATCESLYQAGRSERILSLITILNDLGTYSGTYELEKLAQFKQIALTNADLAPYFDVTNIVGSTADDTLFGVNEGSRFYAQEGNDRLYGQRSSDTYHLGKGHGADTVLDAGGIDQIVFGSGIAQTDLVLSRNISTVWIKIKNADGVIAASVQLDNFFDFDGVVSSGAIEKFVFADHSSLELPQILAILNASAASAGDDMIFGSPTNDSLAGLAGNDSLQGLRGDDQLSGNEGNDLLGGDDGDDLLDGGAGNDTLIGGRGNDTYLFSAGHGNDEIKNSAIGGSSLDIVRFDASVSKDTLQVSRTGADLIIKTSASDSIKVADFFSASDLGSAALEQIVFADGTVWEIADIKRLVTQGGAGNDSIVGYDSNDQLNGFGGADTLLGNDGDDILSGAEGADSVRGGEGNDVLFGGADGDKLVGDDGNDTLDGGDGGDLMTAGLGDDSLIGGIGDDMLHGESGRDTLVAGDGDDLLFGDVGDDFLAGGKGTDKLDGGRGANSYLFAKGDGVDTIVDGYEGQITIYLADLPLDELIFRRDGNNLTVGFNGSPTDLLALSGFFSGETPRSGIRISHQNGDEQLLDPAQLLLRTLDGTEGNDTIHAFSSDDKILVRGGDDLVNAGAGNDTVEGGAGNDRIHAGEGNDLLDGGDGDDALYAEAGDDSLHGGLGNDSLYGYDGADLLNGGVGDDLLDGGAGDDQLDGGEGRDTLNGGYGANRLDSGAGDDLVSAGDGDDTINSGEGNDTVTAGAGVNRLDGGAGDDRISAYDGADTIIGGTGNDTIDAGNGNNQLDGGAGDNKVTSGGGNDTLLAGEGHDLLQAGAGDDLIDAGQGNDTVEGGDGDDQYTFAAGAGTDLLRDTGGADKIVLSGVNPQDLLLRRDGQDLLITNLLTGDQLRIEAQFSTIANMPSTNGVESLQFGEGTVWDYDAIKLQAIKTGDGADVVFAHAEDEQIDGQAGDDQLYGQDGNDELSGGLGGDLLDGGRGNDHLHGGAGADTLYGRDDNDLMYGGEDTDLLDGGSGNDTLQGGTGADTLLGDGDDDQLSGDEGNDSLAGDWGNDQLAGGGDEDTLSGGDGSDTLSGDTGNDLLQGDSEDDRLDGGEGNDTLFGNSGADTLLGGAGDDELTASDDVWQRDGNTLEGGAGNDTLYGSYGDDTYVFNLGDGKDLLIETRHDQAFNNIDASQDTLVFGAGIVLADMGFFRIGSDLIIRHSNGADEITVQNWFGNIATDHFKLDSVVFDGGTTLDIDALEARVITLGSAEAETLMGYRGNADDIRAGAGNDKVFGFSGDDKLYGEDGDDTVMGGNGIAGQTGDDSLYGGAGRDNLFGEDGNDVLMGEAGNDYLDGGLGDDLLRGGADQDQLTGAAGNDSLFGEAGDDKYTYQPGQGQDVIDNSGGGNDGLFFGVSPERIGFSRDGDDLLVSVDKDPSQSVRVIKHFLGGDYAIDYVQPSSGFMLDTVRINQIVAAAEFGGRYDTVIDGAATADQLNGTSGKDLIRGFAGKDKLFGMEGNDMLQAGDGDDYLDGGAGNDSLEGGANDDQLSGGEGDDQLQAGAGNDKYVFTGNWGKDVIDNAGGGSDWLFFSELEKAQLSFKQEGQDLLIGVVGDANRTVRVLNHFSGGAAAIAYVQPKSGNALSAADIATLLGGGSGGGTITGTAGNDNLSGTAQADLMAGGNGNDTLFGQAGNDTVRGEVGDDYLDGGAGNDSLEGGTGKDQLTGGEGDDRLLGGSEDDKYVFTGNWGKDVIDNTGGGSDWLFFSELEKAQLSFKQEGQDLVIGVVGDANRTVRVLNHFSGGAAAIAYLQPKSGNALSAADIARLLPVDPNPPTPGTGGSGPANPADFNQVKDGTANADQLSGASGKDLLRGLGGDDQLFGGAGNDRLEGGDGNDYLSGGYGSGNSGDDLLIGGAGDDQLNGEDGNDRLEGGAGNDSYVFDGASQDVIDNSGGGSDGLFLADGIGAARLSFQRDGDDLLVVVDKQLTTSLRVLKHFKGGEMAIAYVQPSGGNMFTAATIAQMVAAQTIPGGYETLQDGDANGNKLTGAASRDLLRGLGGDDTLFGGLGNDRLEGGDGNDYLSGGYGNVANTGDDILVGGAGSDTLNGEDGKDRLEGEAGNDFYMLAKGAGADVIKDFDATANNSDTVQFKDVKSTEVTAVQKAGVNLVLKYGATDQLTVENYFDATNAVAYRVERFTFSDSVVWTNTQIQAKAVTVAGLQAAALPRPPMVETVSVDQQLASLVSAMAGFSPMDAAQWQQTVPGHEMHVPLMTANRLM
ncbi:hypothetical protein FNU76_11800 [Chitinimonas arctica]|uniref:Haemolysin-type calcium binding-related domain-containing protein n=1 Tax=Chitinimonas arctica TaxID=2594795 RepID=A0A516SFQ1_9NEIS|nr:calcium-binding protein [Chitinimonas arctica]QDQ26991.1 hypothetical protein FNU76_11800 [Chitinimonas arctica]